MPASRTAAVGLTLLLAGGMAACGGDDEGGDAGGGGSSETVSAEAYAADVCAAMKDWATSVQDLGTSLTESFTSNDPADGKEALTEVFGTMADSTGELVSDVEAAGVPDVEGGEEAADRLASAFAEIQSALNQARTDAEELPTDPQGFQQGATELGTTFQEAVGSLGTSLEDAASEELTTAFENEEACSAVQ